MDKYVTWLSPPHLSGDEIKFISDALANNWVAPVGENVNGFEFDLEKYLGQNKYVSVHQSGTSALHLALILLGIHENDEVLCQSLTFVASVNPVLYLKAKPILVDSETDTWNICPIALEEAILDRIKKGKKPKALIVVHIYGMPCQFDEIKSITDKYEIPVIEDSAEALGSFYKGNPCGTLGNLGILSFNGNKIITTSSGGALVSGSREIKDKAIKLASQAKEPLPYYEHKEIGYNYRLSNILAGIGRGQILHLDERVKARRSNFEFYHESLKDIDSIQFQPEVNDRFSNRWLSCILFDTAEKSEKARLTMEKEKIESRPVWKPMHLQPLFADVPKYLNGISEELFKRGLCLPSGSNMSREELEKVVVLIKNVC